jgi:superfamily II DNA or RNA helicase
MDLEVKPDNWVLPNRIGYNKYAYNTFHPSKYPKKDKKQGCDCSDDVCEIPSDSVSLFPQQRIVRDFIQVNSPYRGVLLYHELGSGKSAASIAAAEGYVGKKKVFVFTPASLAQNYENELLKISKIGLNMKKSWTQIKVSRDANVLNNIMEKYAVSPKFIKSDGLVWLPLYNNDIENAQIISNGKKYSSMTSDETKKIDETIKHIIRNRYTFVSYNGLTQKLVSELKKTGFNDSFIIIDEVHNFISRVVNGSKLARSVYNEIMDASNCKMVLLSGTPIINNPYEIASLINLIRGKMEVYKLATLKSSIEPTDKIVKESLEQIDFYKYIDSVHYDVVSKTVNLTLLPEGYIRNQDDRPHIIMNEWKMTKRALLESMIKQLKSKTKLHFSSVKTKPNLEYALPNSKEEFDKIFLDLSDHENPKTKNMDLFQRRILGTLSYYKTSGTEFFPTVLPNKITYLDMTNHQISLYADVRMKERSMDNANKMRGMSNQNGALSDKSSVYRAFSRMVCNFAFPEGINRHFPQDIRKLMKVQLGNDDDDDDDEDDATKTKKENKKNEKEEYQKSIDDAFNKLSTSDFLTKENLEKLYSPKYAKMLDDIKKSPGTVLIYSQFRTMEGIGIFSKVLETTGYKEIVLKKTSSGYVFDDMKVFNKKYDNKRFVIFNSDREKTNILMNLFNGSFSLLPSTIINQLKENVENYEDQLYGKLVKIMMITQSGAEGISLKNVRRVLIMEYFWNSVRIKQVIGRAVRTCSHEMLPKNERNVEIFTYLMKFTKDQMMKDFTLRRQDNETTTDQHIYNMAIKKESIINEFLNMMKSSSFDCIINSIQNEPLKNGYKCYNWAINSNDNDLSYTNELSQDGTILKKRKYQVLKKQTGKVVRNDGIKFVLIDNKLYDYFSYKNAGILLPV